LGEKQCSDLRNSFPNHAQIELMVASPLRRTIHTALLSFEPVFEAHKDFKLLLLPEAQETSDVPCDTGSDPVVLKKEFVDRGLPVDLSLVHDGWNSKVMAQNVKVKSSDLIESYCTDRKMGPDTFGIEKPCAGGETVVEGSSREGDNFGHPWWNPALHH
jgi:hypothetical protein